MSRILIVDDEAHVIRVLAQALERDGYEVDSARNGLQALEKIQEVPPDVLITDIDMPKMTGKELCQRIQESPPPDPLHVFILTSRTELEHREWSREIPDVGFIEKPISIRELRKAIFERLSGGNRRTEIG